MQLFECGLLVSFFSFSYYEPICAKQCFNLCLLKHFYFVVIIIAPLEACNIPFIGKLFEIRFYNNCI